MCVFNFGVFICYKKLWFERVCSFPFRVQNCSSRTIEQPSNPLASFKDAGLTRANDYNPNVVTDRTVPILSPELEACRPRPKKPQRTEPKQLLWKTHRNDPWFVFFRTPLIEHRENKKGSVLLQFLFRTELIGMATFFFTTINGFGRKPGVTFTTNFFLTIVFLG